MRTLSYLFLLAVIIVLGGWTHGGGNFITDAGGANILLDGGGGLLVAS